MTELEQARRDMLEICPICDKADKVAEFERLVREDERQNDYMVCPKCEQPAPPAPPAAPQTAEALATHLAIQLARAESELEKLRHALRVIRVSTQVRHARKIAEAALSEKGSKS